MKFKNLRRPAKAGITLIKEDSLATPSSSDEDMVEYDQHVKYLQKTYKSQ